MPKSIAREMFESYRSFADYVQEYDLERAEGLLLRHLNSVYKVLSQTVPDGLKDDALREMEAYLRDMLRQVDSSLLEEWERMRDPDYMAPAAAGEALRPPRPEEPEDVTRDTKAFTAAVRARLEALMDRAQPGWREVTEASRYFPNFTVMHDVPRAETVTLDAPLHLVTGVASTGFLFDAVAEAALRVATKSATKAVASS